MPRALALGASLAVLLAAAPEAAAQRFYPDDPIARDEDDLPIPKPGAIELSTPYDVLEHTFHHRPNGPIPRAMNANTLGEVPDSSWFTNRPALSPGEMIEGPGGRPPDLEGTLTVVGGKSQGITPGFTVRDRKGDVYFVKFDRAEYPRLSTAADVIVSRLFHAFGYSVPANFMASFRREQLAVAPDARVAVRGGKKRRMTEADLDRMLSSVPRLADGRFLAIASLRLTGEPLGPFKYHGTRGDDPNDVVPHEHRRELRGLRVFSAWLNHDDSRSINSLDMYVGEEGRKHVRHHLIDFSSTMGSGSDALRRISPQNPRAGNEYVLDWGPLARSLFTFGIWDRPWRKVKYTVYPEVGRFEADFYRPERWKGEYANPAFERMLPEDGFWAAKILARVSDDALRAVVHLGGYEDPAAEGHLLETLIRRRDKTIDHYYRQIAPLDAFRVDGPSLVFRNLGQERGLATAAAYEHQWFVFDNATGRRTPLGPAAGSGETRIPIPGHEAEYVTVRIWTRSPEAPHRSKTVDVFLRTGSPRSVVGIEREN